MSEEPLALLDEAGLADLLHKLIEGLVEEPFYQPLRLRLKEMGSNHADEVEQFRQLQKAARRSPELVRLAIEAGLPDLTKLNPRAVTSGAGRIVQAFNKMIEDHWE